MTTRDHVRRFLLALADMPAVPVRPADTQSTEVRSWRRLLLALSDSGPLTREGGGQDQFRWTGQGDRSSRSGRVSSPRPWLATLVASAVATGGNIAVNMATALGHNVVAWCVVVLLVLAGTTITVWLHRRESKTAHLAYTSPITVSNAAAGSISGLVTQIGAVSGSVQIRGDTVAGVGKIVHNYYTGPPSAGRGLASVEQVSAPAGLSNLPVYPAKFVGREDELAALDAILGQNAGRAVVQALHGLGGVGKSTLAARWAGDHQPPFEPLWWITADTSAALDAGLVGLASALEPTLADALPDEVLRDRAVAWMACHDGWLVVLDNVTVPKEIGWLMARVRTGRFLITSRHSDGWHQVATPIRLDVFAPADAVDLVRAVLTHDPDRQVDSEGVETLCAELGYLPLAVEQAAAFCTQTGITPVGYLRLLADTPAAMVATVADGADPDRSVARVWRLTLDRLAALAPLAGRVLRVLAWWAPTGIPRQLLVGLGSEVEVAGAVGRLAAYSMIALEGADELRVHPLVQALSRIPDPNDPHRQSADTEEARQIAGQALAEALPRNHAVAEWPAWRKLIPHIDAMYRTGDAGTDTVVIATLYNEAGVFLLDQGDVATATMYRERSYRIHDRILGSDHPRTLTVRSNLAAAYDDAGDFSRAIPIFEQILTERERTLGPDHPDTLSSRNNLAYTYQRAGDENRAIPMLEQTLTDRERILGPDHPQTLTSRNNLAHAYRAIGDLDRAVQLYEQALADTERILGPNDPQTLAARNNVAAAYDYVGDLDRAIPILEQTLTDRERILGTDHPHTLISQNNLAHAYHQVGNVGRATALFERNLTDTERILGPDHPDTLAARNNLANAYQSVGDIDRAITLYEKALNDAERIFGPDHPTTRVIRDSLDTARAASQ